MKYAIILNYKNYNREIPLILKISIPKVFNGSDNRDSKEVFQKNSQKFTDAFQVELNTKIMDILKSYSHLTQKEITQWKKQFSNEVKKDLDFLRRNGW